MCLILCSSPLKLCNQHSLKLVVLCVWILLSLWYLFFLQKVSSALWVYWTRIFDQHKLYINHIRSWFNFGRSFWELILSCYINPIRLVVKSMHMIYWWYHVTCPSFELSPCEFVFVININKTELVIWKYH